MRCKMVHRFPHHEDKGGGNVYFVTLIQICSKSCNYAGFSNLLRGWGGRGSLKGMAIKRIIQRWAWAAKFQSGSELPQSSMCLDPGLGWGQSLDILQLSWQPFHIAGSSNYPAFFSQPKQGLLQQQPLHLQSSKARNWHDFCFLTMMLITYC